MGRAALIAGIGLLAACGGLPAVPTPLPAEAAIPCRVFTTLTFEQQVTVAGRLVPDDPAFFERVRVAQHREAGASRESLIENVAASLDKGCQIEPVRWTLPTLLEELYG